MEELSTKKIRIGKIAPLICLGTALILLLSSSGTTMFAFASTSATPTFSAAVNLSADLGSAKNPVISSQGLNVYAAWTEGTKGILFRVSTDGGNTWSPPAKSTALKISTGTGDTAFPVMVTQYQAPNSGDVYVAWTQAVKQSNGSKVSQIFVAASKNNGLSFTTTQISHNSTHAQNTAAIAAWGTDVYVSWFSAKNATSHGSDYVSTSTNNGQSWSTPVDVINPSSNGETQIVAGSATNAYIVGDGIDFSATYNSGASWSPQVSLFSPPFNHGSTSVYYGREPWVAAYGDLVYVTWEANSTTAGIRYHDQGVTRYRRRANLGCNSKHYRSVEEQLGTGKCGIWKQCLHDVSLTL